MSMDFKRIELYIIISDVTQIGKILISKYETLNKYEILNSNDKMNMVSFPNFEFSDLEFVSDLEIRISCFVQLITLKEILRNIR